MAKTALFQLAEFLALNQKVAGSSPVGGENSCGVMALSHGALNAIIQVRFLARVCFHGVMVLAQG